MYTGITKTEDGITYRQGTSGVWYQVVETIQRYTQEEWKAHILACPNCMKRYGKKVQVEALQIQYDGKVLLFVKGSANAKTRVGSWNVGLDYEDNSLNLAGDMLDTTGYKCEMMAIVEGLSQLKHPCQVVIFSNLQALVDTLSKARGLGEATQYPELYSQIKELLKIHSVQWQWVKKGTNIRLDTLGESDGIEE